MNKKLKGFTLIECIIAMFILAIMAMVCLQLYGSAMSIYRDTHIKNQKMDQQINIAASEQKVTSGDDIAYVLENKKFKISYSTINSNTETQTCSLNSTLYQVRLDRVGRSPSDANYDSKDENLYNYSYYYCPYTPYSGG